MSRFLFCTLSSLSGKNRAWGSKEISDESRTWNDNFSLSAGKFDFAQDQDCADWVKENGSWATGAIFEQAYGRCPSVSTQVEG